MLESAKKALELAEEHFRVENMKNSSHLQREMFHSILDKDAFAKAARTYAKKQKKALTKTAKRYADAQNISLEEATEKFARNENSMIDNPEGFIKKVCDIWDALKQPEVRDRWDTLKQPGGHAIIDANIIVQNFKGKLYVCWKVQSHQWSAPTYWTVSDKFLIDSIPTKDK